MGKLLRKLLLLLISLTLLLGLTACFEKLPSIAPFGDELAPVFTGISNVFYVIGDETPNYLEGIEAFDEIDGDITSEITIDYSLVDLNVAGTYTVTLKVSDSSGNERESHFDVIVTPIPLTDQEKGELDLAAITYTMGEKLPTIGANGSIISWSSSNTRVISNKGLIINPPIGSEEVTVLLTAKVVNGIYKEYLTFDVLVSPRVESVVTSQTALSFIGTSDEYVVADQTEVDIFFVDEGSLPYIDIETFINLLDGAIESSEIAFTLIEEDILELRYETQFQDFDGSIVIREYIATIDFTENTFTVNNFDFFEKYAAQSITDFGGGLIYVDADYVEGHEVIIPLGDYSFDLVIYEDVLETFYLMPLHVANLLLAGGIYYDVYYNGDMLYGIDTFSISGNEPEDLALQTLIRTSSFNNLTAERDVKEATYHFFALALDYFYGLKQDKGVETYYDLLSYFADDLINGSDKELYSEIFSLAYALDDLHTSHVFAGYYEAPYEISLSMSDLGPSSTSFYDGLGDIRDLIEAKYGSLTLPKFRLIDDEKTVVIYITKFTVNSPGELLIILMTLPETVENVVIDLSYNTGGNIGSVFRILGYMTEEVFQYHSQNPADGSASTYYIGSYSVAFDYNWFIVSSGVTYSAANLMTSMVKEIGIATIIGQQSFGGASSIGVIMSPDGSAMIISTNNILSTRIGNEIDGYEYISIESGVEVDYPMIDVTSDAEIITIINQVNSLN